MKKFLSVGMGASVTEARAVFVSDDPELVEIVLACISLRLEEREHELFSRADEPAWATAN